LLLSNAIYLGELIVVLLWSLEVLETFFTFCIVLIGGENKGTIKIMNNLSYFNLSIYEIFISNK